MAKYLKLFETHAEYEAYINGGVVLPNVSYCEDNNEVHYNPNFFVKLSLNNGEVVELQGSGELTQAMVSQYKSSSIVSVELGELCTSIGDDAFSYCSDLTSITIPNSVTSIGASAFYGCDGLTSITIPNSVTSIGDWAFSYCYGLESIIVENGNTIYDSRDNCNAIIETETNTLLQGCKNTVIPNSVTSIGYGAFSGCKGLTSITIPNSVTSIGDDAFEGCSGLTSITSLAAKAPTIKSNTFYNIKTGGRLTVPSGSSGYETWMSKGKYYLGKYNWTKLEQ